MNLSKFVKAHCWPSMSKGSKFYWKCYNLLMLFNICHICLSNIKAFDVRKIKCSAIKGKRTSLRVTQNQKPRNATSFSKKRDPLPTCYYCLLPQKKTTTWKQKCTRFVDIKKVEIDMLDRRHWHTYGKFYTLKVCKLRLFLLKKKQRKCINISYLSRLFVKI